MWGWGGEGVSRRRERSVLHRCWCVVVRVRRRGLNGRKETDAFVLERRLAQGERTVQQQSVTCVNAACRDMFVG